MLRAVEIDLKISRDAAMRLSAIYERDARSGDLSDEAIGEVSTVIRSLEGALGKTAHAVGQRFVGNRCKPYFPLTSDPAEFEELLQKTLPGLRLNHPNIADAFERQQPYHPEQEMLKYIKGLYRENHHHDFTLQETVETKSDRVDLPAGLSITTSDDQIVFGTPPWQGVPVRREALGTSHDPSVKGWRTEYVDWYFVKPYASVWQTLGSLYVACVRACEDISQAAGL